MSTEFTAKIFRFLHQVNADTELPATDTKVALALTRYFTEDDEGGRAFPSCNTIADDTGLGKATVLRSVRRLHARGHLRVIWGSHEEDVLTITEC